MDKQAPYSICNVANDIQGLTLANSPKQHENDTPTFRLGQAIYAAGEIKQIVNKLLKELED
ncbi:MAG: hypothetical protein ACXABY_25385 [Candidatus Thorarchaeota archaeon]|jgi:hypothetical protein